MTDGPRSRSTGPGEVTQISRHFLIRNASVSMPPVGCNRSVAIVYLPGGCFPGLTDYTALDENGVCGEGGWVGGRVGVSVEVGGGGGYDNCCIGVLMLAGHSRCLGYVLTGTAQISNTLIW